MGNNSCLKNVRLVLLSSKGPLHSNQTNHVINIPRPLFSLHQKEQFPLCSFENKLYFAASKNAHGHPSYGEENGFHLNSEPFSRTGYSSSCIAGISINVLLLSQSKHWSSDRPSSTMTRSPEPITKGSV